MAITVVDNQYVVVLPEHGVRQAVDTTTQQPFANQAAAEAWESAFIAAYNARIQAAQTAAQQAYEASKIMTLTLDVTVPANAVPVNTVIPVTAKIVDQQNQPIPGLTRLFHVPIENNIGEFVDVKPIQMTDGVANTTLNFSKPGHYKLSVTGINSRLEENFKLVLKHDALIVVHS